MLAFGFLEISVILKISKNQSLWIFPAIRYFHHCRDFGYIARDPSTQRHKCHVFRCQVPAQAVARALVINHGKSKKSKLEDSNYELYEANPHDGTCVCVHVSVCGC